MSDIVRPMTAEEYFELPETNQIDELIDGEYIVSPPIALHQLVVGNVYFLVRTSASSGLTVVSPAAIRFEETSVLEPDVFWIRLNGDCRLVENRYWEGAPDLVVEVLSPSTARRDRGIKYEIYERHGVREYWLIDAEAQFIEVFEHAGDGFKRRGIYGVEETFTSPALGVDVTARAIFAG